MADPIMEYVQDALGESYWGIMREYHRRAVGRGLLAWEPAPGFLHEIIELAENGLVQRGLGEERYMQPIWDRLYRRVNPARRMRRVFRTTGVQGVIDRSTIRPSSISATTRG